MITLSSNNLIRAVQIVIGESKDSIDEGLDNALASSIIDVNGSTITKSDKIATQKQFNENEFFTY